MKEIKAMKNMLKTIFAFAFGIYSSQAQESTKGLRISEFHVQSGMDISLMENADLSDFQSLAPNSILLNNDFSEFTSGSYWKPMGPMGFRGNSFQSIQLGLTFKNNPSPLWRIGISHVSSNMSAGYFNETNTPYDTLTSSQTGEQYYVDSVKIENYFMSYGSQQLRIETSLLYRTNPEKRWSLYAGIGMSLGISLNAQTRINYNTYSFVSGLSNNNSYLNNYEEIHEKIVNKTNITSSVFVPMGVDFRIGKNREFWKKIHLYYEMKPTLSFASIPELTTLTSINLSSCLGLKVTF